MIGIHYNPDIQASVPAERVSVAVAAVALVHPTQRESGVVALSLDVHTGNLEPSVLDTEVHSANVNRVSSIEPQ